MDKKLQQHRHSRAGENLSPRAGVSLVTVLLFMLVATIAATATYKWLTSEGRSSGSRLQKQMAYQSAIAGIDNARAWMTFHANDVGALVKQYKDGNYVPINLDANLRSLQRPGQNHHVWLVGVNAPTDGSTYKLKILSSGEASGGARHSEIAIFNVNGLYQVTLPEEEHPKKKIPFDYAYFGGSYDGAGSLTMTSAIVNGNWYGNPQGIEKKFVVTGNADLTGNDVRIGELACVGGNMNPENQGLNGKDIYVGKNFTGNMGHLSGNAYFDGDVTPSSAGEFIIDGNVTLNGNLQTAQSSKNMTFGGNLCLDEDAHILSKGTNYKFESKGDVWMPGPQNIWYGTIKYSGCTCEREFCSSWGGGCEKTTTACTGSGKRWEMTGWATYTLISCAEANLSSDGDNYAKYDKIVLGGVGKTVYIKSGHSWSEYAAMVENKTFTETEGRIIKCNLKPGTMAPDANHGYCDNERPHGVLDVGAGEKWKGYTYSPYPERESKDKLYYSYYLEPGHTDVTLDDFVDEYWIWCTSWATNMFGTKYCETSAPGGVNVLTYFVDGERFWDGYEGHERKRLNYEGGKPTGSPYCTDQTGMGFGNELARYRPKCGVTPWFMSNGTVTNTPPSVKPTCAEAVKDSCDSIWEKKPGCDGSSYKVDDVLVTAKAKFEPYASKGCAASITRYNGDLVTKLNQCYEENKNDATKRETNLYNGYLVVKVSGGTNSTNPAGTLDGKFIIIAQDALYTKLPPTTEGSSVLLYLEKGANTLNDVTVSNYFIYTEGDIGSGNQFNLTGTIYATAESCAGLGKLQSSSLTYNQQLVDDLSAAGVICPNDGSVCGGTGSGGSGGSSDPSGSTSGEEEESSTPSNGTDAYYISMAPQLGVTLESQYENNEALPTSNNQATLSPSFIVLPRVLYLPSDPFGELRDYYNVLPLNGSMLKKADVSVNSCIGAAGGIPTSGKLYTGTALSKGIYKCTAKAGGYDDVPFWVVIGNNHRGSLPITFVDPDQKITAGSSKIVQVVVPPNTPSVSLAVNCPSADDHWSYTLESSGQKLDGTTTCVFPIQGDASTNKVVDLFTVTTDAEATHGSITFQLLTGENYSIGSPYTSMVHMASNATLDREEVTATDIANYCSDHPANCPPEGQRSSTAWPNCTTNETWVEPTGITYGTEIKNSRWNLVVGGSGTLQLVGRDITNCVAIVPNETIDVSTINADDTKQLRASLKALKRTIKLTFVGQITDEPVISISVDGTASECKYADLTGDDKSCYVTAFSGQSVTLSINRTSYPKFNYWDCSGISCPVTDPISSETYNAFTIKDDNSVVYAHFNEADRHCFFDEFKSGTLQCSSAETEYCVDNCGDAADATCAGVVDGSGVFTKSKWHLVSGRLGDIDVVSGNISLHRSGRSTADPVTILSTVNAGTYGTLKALFQLPRETSSHNRNSQEISKSGFLLHSNTTGSEYLMLNMFIGQNGYLEAQLCNNSGRCLNGVLMDANNNPAPVYSSSMIMMSATIGIDGYLAIAAFTGNYYGSPTEYDLVFNLNDIGTSYMDVAHEFVGFSLADASFKLYGIGWRSDTYSAECHDTYPTVKCSFAAVATDGVIPTETYVKPWIGHSGWFDTKKYSGCTEKFYYIGADACSGSATTETLCPSNGYNFKTNGLHGYKEGTTDVKTAKAWLECSVNSEDAPWARETESERAHCGTFWTGVIKECSDHVEITDAANLTLSAGQETTASLTNSVNLRGTSIAVEFNENSGIDVEVWLISENSSWGAQGYASKSIIVTSKVGRFSVDTAMTAGVDGFDPEKVTQIVFKNRTNSALTVKSVVASCKNAVDIEGCTADFADGKWSILIDVKNKDNVATYGAEAKVDGATVFDTTDTNPNQSSEKILFEKADNPYAEYQGKRYDISASIVNKTGSTASKSCDVTPSIIGSVTRSCSVTGSPKKQGDGLPRLNINLDGCPTGGCQYEVYIGDAMLDGYPKSGSGTINVTPDGNGSTPSGEGATATADYPAGTYTYKVKSPVGSSYPFADCETSFEIQEKSNNNNSGVKTECYFDNSGNISQPGANASFHFSVHEKGIDICNLQYKLMLGTTVLSQGSTGCNSEKNIQFSGINTSKSGTVVLQVQDPEDNVYKESCTASITVGSPGITCSKIVESNVDKFKIAVSNPCANSACPWKLVKGSDMANPVSSSSNLGSSEEKIPFSGIGNYTLYVNDEAVSGCTISLGPEVTCPTSKKTYTINQEASLVMTDLKNCGSGCDYDLVVNGSNEKSVEDGSYSSTSTAIRFTPSLALDDVDYTFTVYAHGDHTLKDDCSGKMAFVSGSTCTDKGTWNITSNNGDAPGTTNGASWAASDCFTIEANRVCSSLKLKSSDCINKYAKINGVDILLRDGDGFYDGTFPEAARGTSIRIDMPDKCNITQFFVDGCETISAPTAVPTISNCPSSTIYTWPGETVELPMSLSNCKVTGGCSYTISASGQSDITGTTYGSGLPSITAVSTDNTTIAYTVSVSNSLGSASPSCTFDVGTNSNLRINKSITQDIVLGPGKYQLYCYGNSGSKTMQPSSTAGAGCKSWFNPSISWNPGADYGGCNGQTSVTFPINLDVPAGETIKLNCW